jgi:hypothetical protein
MHNTSVIALFEATPAKGVTTVAAHVPGAHDRTSSPALSGHIGTVRIRQAVGDPRPARERSRAGDVVAGRRAS